MQYKPNQEESKPLKASKRVCSTDKSNLPLLLSASSALSVSGKSSLQSAAEKLLFPDRERFFKQGEQPSKDSFIR
jgi:hypothetical protein